MEIHIKTKMRYVYLPIIIKKTISNIDDNVMKLELSYIAGKEYKMVEPLQKVVRQGYLLSQ